MYACAPQSNAVVSSNDDDSRLQDSIKLGSDVESALAELRDVEVLNVGPAGVPTFIRGSLGRVSQSIQGFGVADAPTAIRPSLDRIAAAFRVNANDLVVTRVSSDDLGEVHVKYQQMKDGLKVVGAELVVHVNATGEIYAANGEARDGVALSATPKVAGETARAVARASQADLNGAQAGDPTLVFFRHTGDGSLHLAYQVELTGTRADGMEVRDLVYVNARNGAVIESHKQIHEALNRAVYSANNGSSLPGTLKRSEGGAASGDAHVDENYAHLGTTYSCYSTLFARDSYNNGGAQLKSTVHYSSNYVNAYWNGTQMVYGDGDGVDSGMLGKDLDVTVHELTHAVTDSESDLVYQNESGALNEGMSDIFAAVCESWTRSWATDADVFKIGEDIWTPATAGDALRYMGNPTQDGQSYDYYPERYTGTQDSGGVHLNSGIANLAFKLLATGGTHPRGKTTVSVTGIGVEKAGRIAYKANTDIMTASTNFSGARAAFEQAATSLYGAGSAEVTAVSNAWAAVGVGSGGTTPPAGTVVLTDGVAKTGTSGALRSSTYYKISVPSGQSSLKVTTSGGSGDADLYVRQGSNPTTTTYNCKSESATSTETCTIASPVAGDYFILVYAYSAYSNVSVMADYTGTVTPPTGNVLTNGVAVSISGASGSSQTWTMSVPAGKASLSFAMSGGTGDADMYVKFGSAPTTTSYTCRPYLNGNNETCNFTSPAAGTWYVMIRGYSAFSGASLKGTHP